MSIFQCVRMQLFSLGIKKKRKLFRMSENFYPEKIPRTAKEPAPVFKNMKKIILGLCPPK